MPANEKLKTKLTSEQRLTIILGIQKQRDQLKKTQAVLEGILQTQPKIVPLAALNNCIDNAQGLHSNKPFTP